MSFDYLIGRYDLKPFVGASLGYGYEKDSNLNLQGALFGTELGVNYKF